MNWPAMCGVVIPCLNEEATVGELVQAVHKHLPTVVVVDDGSSDSTADRAADAGAQVISNEKSLGKGAALQLGTSALLKKGFSYALLMDGDGQHRPEDIPVFLNCAIETGAELIIGNRMPDAEAIPSVRRFVNRWMSRRISRRAGRELPDTQCGFRLVKLQAWKDVQLQTQHFEIESEMLLRFVREGYKVEFVPIQVVGKARTSHIHVLKDSWRWFRWWFSARAPSAVLAADRYAGKHPSRDRQ